MVKMTKKFLFILRKLHFNRRSCRQWSLVFGSWGNLQHNFHKQRTHNLQWFNTTLHYLYPLLPSGRCMTKQIPHNSEANFLQQSHLFIQMTSYSSCISFQESKYAMSTWVSESFATTLRLFGHALDMGQPLWAPNRILNTCCTWTTASYIPPQRSMAYMTPPSSLYTLKHTVLEWNWPAFNHRG